MESEGKRVSEDIYKRPIYDEKAALKNFFQFYSSLVDRPLIEKNMKAYIKKLEVVEKLVSKVDFNSNILFICDKNIAREVYLSGFRKMSELTSYYFCNMIHLVDIWWGNMKENNPNISSEDLMFSEQNIQQDVLCMYINKDMYSVNGDKVINTVITSRAEKLTKKKKPMYTWVFFEGAEFDMNIKGFSLIKTVFENNRDRGYQIINLSSEGISNINQITRTGKVGPSNSSLEEMY